MPPIVQAADGSFDLPAAQAMIHSEKLFYEKGDTKDNLGRWIDVEDWASWKLRVNQPGRFRVLLTYSAPRGVHGGTFAVSAGGSSVSGKVQPTGAWETFREFEAGTLSVPTMGTVELALRAVEKPTAALMNLRRIRLVPVEK